MARAPEIGRARAAIEKQSFDGATSVRHGQLWAPWRLGYIQGTDAPPPSEEQSLAWLPGADPQCFLCRGVAANAGGTKLAGGTKPADGANLADRQNLIV